MLKCRSGVVVLVATLLSLACICSAADKKQLENALAAVNANLGTPAGKQYDDAMGKEFPEKYWSKVRDCKQSMPVGTAIDPFDMFLKLAGDGKVQEALVHPETRFAECTRAALLTGQFSNPPHDGYWINIHLQITAKK